MSEPAAPAFKSLKKQIGKHAGQKEMKNNNSVESYIKRENKKKTV